MKLTRRDVIKGMAMLPVSKLISIRNEKAQDVLIVELDTNPSPPQLKQMQNAFLNHGIDAVILTNNFVAAYKVDGKREFYDWRDGLMSDMSLQCFENNTGERMTRVRWCHVPTSLVCYVPEPPRFVGGRIYEEVVRVPGGIEVRHV